MDLEDVYNIIMTVLKDNNTIIDLTGNIPRLKRNNEALMFSQAEDTLEYQHLAIYKIKSDKMEITLPEELLDKVNEIKISSGPENIEVEKVGLKEV